MKTPNPWSYKYIRRLAEEATVRAKERDLRPVTAREAVVNWRNSRRFNLPFLGDYIPEGWETLTTPEPFFVDCTGRRRDGEDNVVSNYEFYRRLQDWQKQHPDWGFGIIEIGQNMALVACYCTE